MLLFAGAVSLLAVIVFSLTPALRLSLSNLREDLAEGGRGSAGTLWKRFGANLVVAELAMTVAAYIPGALAVSAVHHRLVGPLRSDF